jgi:HPt (histidine-containing phosphotransfer) domain-containing protein
MSLSDLIIPGINTESGLSALDNDIEYYLSILHSYAVNTPKIIDKLRNVTDESLTDYAITMHGMKSASGSIGAENLKKMAASLELMAKSGNLTEVITKNEAFLEGAENIVSDIQEYLKELYAKFPKPQFPAPNRNLLAYLQESCERYDMDSIDKVMDVLENANYDTDGSFVIWLRENVDVMNFSEIVARLAEYKEK